MTTPEKVDANTTTTEKAEKTTAEQQEAEAGFEAGFNKVRGEETPPKTDDTTTDGAAKAKPVVEAVAAPAKAAATDPWKDVPQVVRDEIGKLSGVQAQIRNLAGHIGGINSKLDTALATAKAAAVEKGGAAAAPSDKQVEKAMAGGTEEWNKLKDDYPDWAGPLEKQFTALRGEIAKVKGPAVDMKAIESRVTTGVNAALAAGFDAAEERAFVRLKHPDWKETVNTPEFKSWTLEGGPSIEAYSQMKALESRDPAKADAMVNGWARQHPQWWADRGAAIFDERADAAIKLLDGFASRTTVATPEAKAKSSQTRLARALPAAGSGAGGGATGISDEAAFNRGFQKAAKK